jgi:hypothetical protein
VKKKPNAQVTGKKTTPAEYRAKARAEEAKAHQHNARAAADTSRGNKEVVTDLYANNTGATRAKQASDYAAAAKQRAAARTASAHAATDRAKARKASTTVARSKKRASLGGSCAWEAFGVRRKWYQPTTVRISDVAKYCDFVRGDVAAGGVVGVYIHYGHRQGYHAAKVLWVKDDLVTVDLWGAPTVILLDQIQESWVHA